MKVAMIGQKGIPSRAGGIEVHVEELAKRLAGQGCDLIVYCREGYSDALNGEPIQSLRVQKTSSIKSKHLDAISHTLSSTIHALFAKCDIFHYHALGPSTLSFIPRLFGKKVVCTVHGLDWQRAKWGKLATTYLKFGEYATAKFSHETITVSDALVDYYKNKYTREINYIPNGVEKPTNLSPDIILNKYGLDKDSYVLFLARLVPEKGAHYLIEAFKSLPPGKKLVIAGGSSHSDEYAESLRRLAADRDDIVFTGFVTGDELKELYSNCYLYVLPSDIEGLPISLLEAMSYENYCLTSDIAENANIVGKLGATFAASNTADLANKLRYLLDHPDVVQSSRAKTREYVIQKYNWDDICQSTLNVYKRLG
ncbi:glycosyltransferase family 4 protein [Paenibacillus sp. OV219]|uniref:glycosyltransferase family 4 protein n=1 Tax=Paenibacillus sp. OV219 TaxID=1884377 RepID=UPI0008C13C82|nr:glycosyltransferase family 4 protein [Paenibacillus sp. OV219]SEO64165.1 Glycosyltransferase involved in cell wall bisynthesis [Paenibacillus sp. OV219]